MAIDRSNQNWPDDIELTAIGELRLTAEQAAELVEAIRDAVKMAEALRRAELRGRTDA